MKFTLKPWYHYLDAWLRLVACILLVSVLSLTIWTEVYMPRIFIYVALLSSIISFCLVLTVGRLTTTYQQLRWQEVLDVYYDQYPINRDRPVTSPSPSSTRR